jgi:molybdopterin synthase sulfur carrier subunit
VLPCDSSGHARAVSATVQLPAALREHAAGAADVEVDATDVDGVLAELARRFPRLRRHLFNDAGALRDFVRIYLNDEDVRGLPSGGGTHVHSGDVILIVPSIAGGAVDSRPHRRMSRGKVLPWTTPRMYRRSRQQN